MKRIIFEGVVKNFYYFKKDYRLFSWLYSAKGHEKEFRVLKGLNFEIDDGEIVGILGANGAGKSTTLKMIAGIYTPTSGDITVNGSVTSLLELGAGFNPILSGRENIYYKGNLLGLSKDRIDEIVDDIIEFADIGEYIDMPLTSYSSGMGARLGFALAVMVDPEILIIDEVFAVGDKDFQQKSREKTMQFFEQGKTILFVSHSEDLIRTFCNRVIYLHDGYIKYDGEVEKGIELYHKDIQEKSKVIAGVFDKVQVDDNNIHLYVDIGRVYNGKVFESVDFDKVDLTIHKVAVETRVYHEEQFINFSIQKIDEKKVKLSILRKDVLNQGFIGFKIRHDGTEDFIYIYKGDDTLYDNNEILMQRHLSRKHVFKLSEDKY